MNQALTEELKSMFDVTHQRFNIRSQGLLDEDGDIQHFGYKYEVATKASSTISENDFYELNKTTMITYSDVKNQTVKKTIKVPQA
ncbi:hypothetical protein MX850_07090 [Erysipelothrix sp. Poltava]|nr:hypothetical protein MX850_07090 [Erysipelothrix sp. Poltava]